MDIEKLIKRLNCPQIHSCPMNGDYPSCTACQKSVKQDATFALSTLQAENDQLQAELEQKEKYYEQMVDALAATESTELEQVKRERDAAVNCIKEIEDALNFQRISAISLRISEWRGQKED